MARRSGCVYQTSCFPLIHLPHMEPRFKPFLIAVVASLPFVVTAFAACSQSGADESGAVTSCAEPGTTLQFGYYAFFEPISYVVRDEQPYRHYGYEADLVTALEAIDGANLQFERSPIEEFEGIWLRSSDEFDVVGGAITILEPRTKDESGTERIQFTNGHINFPTSLMTRTEDADRLTSYESLTSDVRIGVLAGTTGEARLLRLVGLADADGVLLPGTRVQTPRGEAVADGSSDYYIALGERSPELEGRTTLTPPSADYPTVIYLGEEVGEIELLDALEKGEVDALARWEIGNVTAARASAGKFAVPLVDSESELGGFTLSAAADDLTDCLNEHIDYLTDNRNIGYEEWLEDEDVFIKRADSR